MNLDEANKIESDRKNIERSFSRLRQQLKTLVNYRQDETVKIFDVLREAYRVDGYYAERNEAVFQVEKIIKHDFIKIAEMNLQAKIRALTVQSKLKEQQISEYFEDK